MCTALTDWSLDQLLNNSLIEAVGVSTDDEEIYAHARAKDTVVSALAPQSFALIRRQNGQFGNIHWPLLKKIGQVSVFVDLVGTAPQARKNPIPHRDPLQWLHGLETRWCCHWGRR